MSENEIHTVTIIAQNEAGDVWLIKRFNTGFADGYYSLPTGHVEEGEDEHEAAIREAFEEMGIEVNLPDLKKVAISHSPYKLSDNIDGVCVNHHFLITAWEGEIRNTEGLDTDNPKCDDALFVPINNLPDTLLISYRVILENMDNSDNIKEYEFGLRSGSNVVSLTDNYLLATKVRHRTPNVDKGGTFRPASLTRK